MPSRAVQETGGRRICATRGDGVRPAITMNRNHLAVALLVLVPATAAAKGPHSKTTKAERERAAQAAKEAARQAEQEAEAQRKAQVEAEAEKLAAEKAKAAEEATFVTVRIESNYPNVRLDPVEGASESLACTRNPCVLKVKIGATYRASAPGMVNTDNVVANEHTRVIRVNGRSLGKRNAGIATAVVGILAMGAGGVMIQQAADDDSTYVDMGLLKAGMITAGIGIVAGVTGLILRSGSSSVNYESAPTPAARSKEASKPRLLPSGTLVF